MRGLAVLVLLSGCFCSDWDLGEDRTDIDGDPFDIPSACGDELPPDVDPDLVGGTPDGIEVCNTVDDDCDGLVDTDDPDLQGLVAWVDADGDGYGDPDSAVVVCAYGDGAVDDGTDCDDADPAAHPGGEEAWGDDADGDCDGDIDPDPCEVEPTGDDVDADPTCTLTGWFQPTVELLVGEDSTVGTAGHSVSTPVVGQLTDDDGDGDVDADDIPDIAWVQTIAFSEAIRFVNGDGSGEVTELPTIASEAGALSPSFQSQLALGDVDGDGAADLVGTWQIVDSSGTTCRLGAQRSTGERLWLVQDVVLECRHHAPALADLTGDGTVEVILGDLVVAGATGAVLWEGGLGRGQDDVYVNGGRHSFGYDLDGDGPQEVLGGRTIYEANGDERCSLPGDDGYPAVADLDGDGIPEVVLSGAGLVRVLAPDCALLDSWPTPDGGRGGPPTLADFDGDGLPEIGVASVDNYFVFEATGTLRWAAPVQDVSSNSTGSAAFDFDGDGAAEAVYADEEALWIFDGATGAVLLEDDTRISGTRNEYPVVADVDQDGSAEIVVANDGGDDVVVFVVGETLGRWPNARPIWPQHAFRHDAFADDGSLAPPEPPTHNSFRQGHATSAVVDPETDPFPVPDLGVRVWGSCQETPLLQRIWIQAVNTGALDATAQLLATAPFEFGNGELTLLDEPVTVPAGGESQVFETLVQTPGVAAVPVTVVIDPDDDVPECDELDNWTTMQVSRPEQ